MINEIVKVKQVKKRSLRMNEIQYLLLLYTFTFCLYVLFTLSFLQIWLNFQNHDSLRVL